jgi:photosynthetic reaction center H subunit
MHGAITQHIDVAQIVLYVFWIFFAGLIYYLLQENKREGYPLESDRSPFIKVQGFPAIPAPKTYLLRDGSTRTAPTGNTAFDRDLQARPAASFPGAPLEPLGNPMLAGVGPGAYANRPDVADKTIDGRDKLIPLRLTQEFKLAKSDPNPIGFDVVGADAKIAGVVVDAWVDQSETLLRYLEVKLSSGNDATRNVLLPINFCRIGRDVRVRSILAHQFADVPVTRSTESVTLLEEERIHAYYGAGTLYAVASRQEPLL